MTGFKTYPFQEAAIEETMDFIINNKGNPLVVAPTGSGKSLIAAELIIRLSYNWPQTRILLVSHVKEILEQDYYVLKIQKSDLEVGLYSAGLNSRTIKKITIAGIQSLVNNIEKFKNFDIIIIDEAHLIPFKSDTRYRKLFEVSSNSIKIGLTATPYRTTGGYLHEGENSIFDGISFLVGINDLQSENILCKLRSPETNFTMDSTNIKIQAGDYILKELSLAFDRKRITLEIIKELLNYKRLAKHWLVFAIDIDHANHISEELNRHGILTKVIHSKINKNDRVKYIENFKKEKYQALVSVAMLTTGIDIPKVDLIAGLRATISPILHTQIPGRGMRVYPNKKFCWYLDFAGNLKRNGPIDDPIVQKGYKNKRTGQPMVKTCKVCKELVALATRICPVCNYKFEFKHNLTIQPSELSLFSQKNWHVVEKIKYDISTNKEGIDYLKATYFCGLRSFSQPICFNHKGYARYMAIIWWRNRWNENERFVPNSTKDALSFSKFLKKPIKIYVDESKKYPKIKEFKWK